MKNTFIEKLESQDRSYLWLDTDKGFYMTHPLFNTELYRSRTPIVRSYDKTHVAKLFSTDENVDYYISDDHMIFKVSTFTHYRFLSKKIEVLCVKNNDEPASHYRPLIVEK